MKGEYYYIISAYELRQIIANNKNLPSGEYECEITGQDLEKEEARFTFRFKRKKIK